jgi:phage-related protein
MAPGATSATQQAMDDFDPRHGGARTQEQQCQPPNSMRNVMRTNKRRKVKVKTLQREKQ